MTTLYELAGDYKKLLDSIHDCEEINPEHQTQLVEINDSIENKCKNIAIVIKNLEHIIDGLSERIENLVKRESYLVKKTNWLKGYLIDNLMQMQIKEIRTVDFDIKIRENKYQLEINRPDLIEQKYIRHKTTSTIDRQQIIKDIKEGINVEGAQFKTSRYLVLK